MMNKNKKYFSYQGNKKGFSLIEMVMSLAITSVVLIIVITIIINVIRINRFNLDRFVAVAMAEEGIELAHLIRDSNWLQNHDYDSGGIKFWGEDFSTIGNGEVKKYNISLKNVSTIAKCDLGSGDCDTLKGKYVPLEIKEKSLIAGEENNFMMREDINDQFYFSYDNASDVKPSKYEHYLEVERLSKEILRVNSVVKWTHSGVLGNQDQELVLTTDLTEWKTSSFNSK